MAIVYTLPVWSAPIGLAAAVLLPDIYEYHVTMPAIAGALVVAVGVILLVCNPSELFLLREVE